MELFIVGRYLAHSETGTEWEFQGVFDSLEKAEAACLDGQYFVGPALLNKAIGPETISWPGCYYPKASV